MEARCIKPDFVPIIDNLSFFDEKPNIASMRMEANGYLTLGQPRQRTADLLAL